MKARLKKASKFIRGVSRKIRGKKEKTYPFKRVEQSDAGTHHIINLLNYTKTSGQSYDGKGFPAGYHTLSLKNLSLEGQRHPKERYNLIPFNFEGKTVLDIGSNQGGMLFEISDRISHGVGIDFDYRLVNASNGIKSYTKTNNLDFYVFDLEKDPLDLIRDFLPDGKVDIIFLLAVCMWIKNWKEVIEFTAKIGKCLLFETNGTEEQQYEQEKHLNRCYKKVHLLSPNSPDDPNQQSRRLFLCGK